MTPILPLDPPRIGNAVLVVVNPHASGIREPSRTAAELRAAFAAAGRDAETVITQSVDDLRALVASAGDRRLVLVGGDGVLHAVANLGLQELPELALIPAGRANNIARGLGIPTDVASAAALAARGPAAELDLIEITTPTGTLRAVEGVSAGFQAAARSRYHAENSGAVGRGALALLQTLRELPHFRTRLSIDDGPAQPVEFEQLFLNTLPYFAFGLEVDPGADPRDGTDEAVFLHARSRHGVLGMLLAARRGHMLDRSGVEVRPWHSAALLDAVPLAADAVPLGTTTARLRVLPRALRLVSAGALSDVAA